MKGTPVKVMLVFSEVTGIRGDKMNKMEKIVLTVGNVPWMNNGDVHIANEK